MKQNPFGDIKRKSHQSDFIESAKVDGSNVSERRGSQYTDAKGCKIALGGKTIQVPVNQFELELLQSKAKDKGLSLAAYLRFSGMNS